MSSKNKNNKKCFRTMDLILVVVGITLISFTVAMIFLFEKYGSVPDTLITCVFATLGGECGIMGWIKTTKEKNQNREWLLEDAKRNERQQSKIDRRK